MNARTVSVTAAILLAAQVFANEAVTSTERLRYDVYFLASDALEGRRTGTVGANTAADFIASQFRQAGLEPRGDAGSFLQAFTFISGVRAGSGTKLTLETATGPQSLAPDTDFRPLSFSSSGSAEAEVVFAGYGIHAADLGYDDFAGLDVKGKIVLVLRFSPDGDDPGSRFQPYMALRRKVADARELGAAAVLVATGPVAATETQPVKISFDASFADSGLPAASISTPAAETLFAAHGFTLAELQRRINERKEPASRPLGVRASLVTDVIQERSEARNVLGWLEGSDPSRRGEALVIGAHYDHLGHGGEGSGSLAPDSTLIHHGADDNASGVAGLLEIAQELAANRPARSVLFAAFSGEEEGLLGSQHLVQHLPMAREKVIAMINLDMIGRPKPGPSLTIGGVGTAREWSSLLESLNANHHLKISTNAGGFGASDHSSFYGAEVPVLFFFTGAHEDYHKPSDDASRINFRGMGKVVAFVTDLSRTVANLPARPTFERVAEEAATERRPYKVRTGVIPEFGYEGPGFKISGVRGGSPADKGGLKAGDVIVRFGEREIRNIYDYMYALNDHSANETVVLTVHRSGEMLKLPVTLEPGGGAGR